MSKSALICAVMLVSFGAQVLAQESPPPRIVTVGTGRVVLPATRARLQFGAESRGATAEAASAANDRRVERLMASLRGLRSLDSLRVISLWVAPNEDDDGKVLDFEASASIELIARDLAALNTVLDSAVRGGATRLGRVTFEIDSVGPARREALRRAGSAAQDDAVALARAFGRSLGSLRRISAGGGMPNAYNSFEEASVTAGYGSAEFGNSQSGIIRIGPAPRDIVVTEHVTAEWDLAP